MGIPGSKNGGTVPYKAIFWGVSLSPYIGLIYGRYLQCVFVPFCLDVFQIFHRWKAVPSSSHAIDQSLANFGGFTMLPVVFTRESYGFWCHFKKKTTRIP